MNSMSEKAKLYTGATFAFVTMIVCLFGLAYTWLSIQSGAYAVALIGCYYAFYRIFNRLDAIKKVTP